jgi:hypothetical protein
MDNVVGQFSANRKFGNDYKNARTILNVGASHASPQSLQPTARLQAEA